MNSLPSFRILMIDDRQDQYMLVRDFLSLSTYGTFEVDWAESLASGRSALTRGYDACLVDYELGDDNGLHLIREVIATQIDVPMILITGHKEREIDIEALRAGAVDYISKSELKPSLLERTIRYAIERGRTLRALRTSETRLRQVLATVTVGVFITRGEQFIYVNQMVSKMTGYSADKLYQCHFFDLIHPDIQTLVESRTLEMDYTTVDTPIEIPLRRKDGEVLWVSLTTNTIEHEGELAILGAMVDITRNHQMQIALRESEKRFRSLIENSYDYILLVDGSGTITYVSPATRRITGYTEQEVLGSAIADFWHSSHPEDAQRMHAEFAALKAREKGAVLVSRARFRHKDGSWIWLESAWTNLLTEPGVEAIVMNVRDITESIRALETAQAQRKFAEALLDTASALNSTLDFDNVLDRILTNLGKVIAHDGANIMLVEKGITRMVGCQGYDDTLLLHLLKTGFSVDKTLSLQTMIQTRCPLIIPDTTQFEGWMSTVETERLLSYIGIPIIADDEVIGFINIDSFTANFYHPEDAERLTVFGDQAAIAIQNAHAYQQARELAATQERQRLARDLHDAVSQTLFSASVIAETLPRLIAHNPDEVVNGLHQLAQLTRGALAEMRTLLIELRPTDMVDIDLNVLIGHLVNGFHSRIAAELHFEISGDEYKLPVETKITLYRITQEALNNIVKHARPRHVDLRLSWQADGVLLSVTDDGRGFVPDHVPANHMGLRIMQERATTSMVALEIVSEPGMGTHVRAEWRKRPTYE
jgi:PAS domain S-box-containing protein